MLFVLLLLFTWKSVINTWKSTWSIVSHREDKWQSQKLFLPIFFVSLLCVFFFSFNFLGFHHCCCIISLANCSNFFSFMFFFCGFSSFHFSSFSINFCGLTKKTIWSTTSEKEIYVKLCHHLHTHTHTLIWVTSTKSVLTKCQLGNFFCCCLIFIYFCFNYF